MWKLDHKEDWVPKNWCFWTVVLEKTLESPLDCKEIKPVNPKGNQPRIFIGRTDAEVEASILWPPDVKSLLTGKDPDARKDWGQEDRRIRVWQRMRHEFEQAPRDGEGRGSVACCSWLQRVRHDWVTGQQQFRWLTLKVIIDIVGLISTIFAILFYLLPSFLFLFLSFNTFYAFCSLKFFIYLFIFGCAGPLLLRVSFLQLWVGATLLCSARASHCCGFSCRAQPPEHRLSSCHIPAYLLHSLWNLPGPGIESVSPKMAGGFLTTKALG